MVLKIIFISISIENWIYLGLQIFCFSHLLHSIISHITTLILARIPRRSTGDKVASVFEFSVCLFVSLFVCLSVLGKFSNFFLQ